MPSGGGVAGRGELSAFQPTSIAEHALWQEKINRERRGPVRRKSLPRQPIAPTFQRRRNRSSGYLVGPAAVINPRLKRDSSVEIKKEKSSSVQEKKNPAGLVSGGKVASSVSEEKHVLKKQTLESKTLTVNSVAVNSVAASSRRSGKYALSQQSLPVSVAGSAGEEIFQQEIRTVVEREVGKLLAPLEKQLQEERERREKAEGKVRKLMLGQAVSELPE